MKKDVQELRDFVWQRRDAREELSRSVHTSDADFDRQINCPMEILWILRGVTDSEKFSQEKLLAVNSAKTFIFAIWRLS